MATREEIYLAALLHDIGKFWQRADDNGLKNSKVIDESFKKFEETFCPKDERGRSHKHVMWTAYFIEKYQNFFKNLLGSNRNSIYGDFMHLCAKHHNATTIEERIIQKADHYSAGLDRTLEEGWKDAEEEDDNKWDSFKRIQMRSIFSSIGGNDNYTVQKIPLSTLALTDEYIEYKEIEIDYKQLWEEFEKEFKFLQTNNFKIFAETLLFLLNKYTTRIPASTRSYPDVSLYDHLKISAAFAISLYDYIKEKNLSLLPDSDHKPFILIGGDLSGIQKFIYSIAARGAAKNLKGRSFYLQLLIENIVHYVIENLNLYSSNVVYNSGGGFYIIAPNTDFVKSKLQEIIRKIEEQLLKYHKTELYLAIDYIEFGENEILNNNIGFLWDNLHGKLRIRKNQKFKNIIKENFEYLFVPDKNFIPDSKRDYITGEILKENYQILDNDNPESNVNDYTYKQIILGRSLKDADYWIISKEKLIFLEEQFINPIDLGYYNYLVNEKFLKDLQSFKDNVIIKRINNLNFLETIKNNVENIYGFVFYGGNDYPKDQFGNPKTFEELAGVSYEDEDKKIRDKSVEFVRLGILRMDVDNLGKIFKEGFNNKELIPSFSRYTALSRNLDLFFSGYLNTLWKSNKEYREYTQIIYSGGDDVFIVGKWDVLIDFAVDIYKKFKKWTCNNELFGVSCGITIVPPKFPILKAADLADSEEKNAKNHKLNNKEKNSISIFGYAFRWEEEFKEIINLKNNIKELLHNDQLAQSFPSLIYNLMTRAYPEFKDKDYDETFQYRVKWLIAYSFKRAIQRHKEEETKQFLEKWGKYIFTDRVDEIKTTNYKALQILAIAARWADYELRSLTK